MLVQMNILLRKVMHHVCWFSRRKQATARAVAEEPQVAVIGDNMYRGIPRDLRGCGRARADVVNSANIATIEADTWALAEHDCISRVSGGEWERGG